ncbi:MAG TPA: RluA family pseudouridine synthase [bacterium]|nr:RluA family pseudouridine synthase [bacterium]
MYKILYEDKDLLVIDKLSTVPCIRLGDSYGLSDELIIEFPMLASIPDYGFTHRLDNETLGVMLLAKNVDVYEKIRVLFENKNIKKTYHARVKGCVQEQEGRIDVPIAHSLKSTKKMVAVKDGYRVYRGQARPAMTRWIVLNKGIDSCDLELHTDTGVRHQIRVHLLSIGHPICGDRLYNKDFLEHPSLMLISKRMSFVHPNTQQNMQIESEIELSSMFREFF